MITTTFRTMQQTRRLGISITTHDYDTGELEALLAETGVEPRNNHSTQFLSPELLAQILTCGGAAAEADGDEHSNGFTRRKN